MNNKCDGVHRALPLKDFFRKIKTALTFGTWALTSLKGAINCKDDVSLPWSRGQETYDVRRANQLPENNCGCRLSARGRKQKANLLNIPRKYAYKRLHFANVNGHELNWVFYINIEIHLSWGTVLFPALPSPILDFGNRFTFVNARYCRLLAIEDIESVWKCTVRFRVHFVMRTWIRKILVEKLTGLSLSYKEV